QPVGVAASRNPAVHLRRFPPTCGKSLRVPRLDDGPFHEWSSPAASSAAVPFRTAANPEGFTMQSSLCVDPITRPLTSMERQVIRLVSLGCSLSDMAAILR